MNLLRISLLTALRAEAVACLATADGTWEAGLWTATAIMIGCAAVCFLATRLVR